MKVVILAGGFGTRLSEKTNKIPKPMVQIGDKPILWHIMKTYAHYGFNEFIICLGYKGYVIKEWFSNYFIHNSDITIDLKNNDVKVHNSHEDDWKVSMVDTGIKTGTGGRLKKIKKYLDNDEMFLMTYGDGISDVNIKKLVDFHKNHGKLATLTAVQPKGRYGALKLNKDKVMNFSEKKDNEDIFINGGFFVLNTKVMNYIDNYEQMWEKEPIEKITKINELMAFKHYGFWKAMDKLSDKKELDKLWKGSAPWRIWKAKNEIY